MLRLSRCIQGRQGEADASVGRNSKRRFPAVLDVVVSGRVRASVAAILLVFAAAMPALAAGQSKIWLEGASASPTTGTTTTDITFSVTYHNQEPIAPAYVNVTVAGGSHAMAQSGNSDFYHKGVSYSVTLRLPAGSWTTEFAAGDSNGSVGSMAGPTVTIQGPSPTPTPTPKPTPTPVPQPTAAPTAKPTPQPTPRPAPTPSPTPKPTPTPAPTVRPTPQPTPTPKPTPTPMSTPKPTPTSKPMATPQPTPAPTLASTPEPMPTPSPATQAAASPTTGPTVEPAPDATAAPTWTPSAGAMVSPPGTTLASPSPSAEIAVVVPPVGGSTGGAGAGGQGSGGGSTVVNPPPGDGSGPAGDAAPFGSSSSAAAVLVRLMPTMIVTTGGVAMSMAFFAFGRRRRDEAPTAPDAVLAAAAARGMPNASASNLVPAALLVADSESISTAVRAAAVAPAFADPADSDIPRWRRQSLLDARKADPTRSVRTAVNLTFSGQAGEAVSGLERRPIRYRLVSLLDQPDDVRGVEIGSLDEGDEVVLLERLGAYWRVICPDGREGWLHKMVLGAPIADAPPALAAPPSGPALPASAGAMPAPRPNANGGASWTAGDEGPAIGTFEDVLRLYSERRRKLGDA